MAQREPTAAQALYPHLPASKVEREQSRQEASPLAQAMYGPKPPEDWWSGRYWEMVGLRKVDAQERKR